MIMKRKNLIIMDMDKASSIIANSLLKRIITRMNYLKISMKLIIDKNSRENRISILRTKMTIQPLLKRNKSSIRRIRISKINIKSLMIKA